jgi:hypothetical protein
MIQTLIGADEATGQTREEAWRLQLPCGECGDGALSEACFGRQSDVASIVARLEPSETRQNVLPADCSLRAGKVSREIEAVVAEQPLVTMKVNFITRSDGGVRRVSLHRHIALAGALFR